MANPRELAEQAFALLQNALSEQEARASDLDDQLKRKRAPKNRLEEQLDVLSHRLESIDAERQKWEQQAGQLEEIAEAERVKVAQLKKKLEIAESGPEKLTKKEVNFWRAKAETIDAQIKEYQERLTSLRRELNERDAAIEKLQAGGGLQPAAEPVAPEPEPDSELRRQLDQRDQWLAELRLELHELRGQPAPPLETQAEVETLRSQITNLERSLAESHNLRAAAQGDLMRAEHEIAARERAVRETAAAGERARITLAEREHRISELVAEAEHLRNDLRQRDEIDRAGVTRYEEQITALTRDAEALRSRIDQDRHDSGAARAALEIALHEREHEIDKQRQLLAANQQDFEDLRQQVAERDRVATEARRQLEEQRRDVFERERELADCQQQMRDLSQALAQRDHRHMASANELEQARAALAEHGQELAGLREALQNAQRELDNANTTLSTNERDLHAARAALAAHEGELEQARGQLAANEDEVQRARAKLAANERELEHARATLTANEREIDSLRDTLSAGGRELDELRSERQRLQSALGEAEGRAAAAAGDMEAAREQMAGLESELKEEREHAESLGELANERREHMTKLQEQVEEAEERFADANWRLGKSLYFERIVKRRKGLIQKLLEALRAKMKANVALKAGIDGLRKFKQTAEMNQHKLLQRIDALKAELKEAEETVKRHQGGTAAKEELTTAVARATGLEERLARQAELIESLEADLKKARHSQKASTEQTGEFARLSKELVSKNELIEKLQADTDDQQRKLAKLRGSESETMRLKAETEKDRTEIDALQREIAQLREALARQSATPASADLEAKLKEREASLTRLMSTIKEHESTIKKLTDSAESWKRKYQFLASDQPDAYKNVVEK